MMIRSLATDNDITSLAAFIPDLSSYLRWLDEPTTLPVAFVAEFAAGSPIGLAIVRKGVVSWQIRDNVSDLYLRVADSHRRQGVGKALLQAVQEASVHTRLHAAQAISTFFPIEKGDTCGADFCVSQGFTLLMRNANSHVDLTRYDPVRFHERTAALQKRYGLRFVTMAEAVKEPEEAWWRLYALEAATRPDIPSEESRQVGTFAGWSESLRSITNFPETILIAVVADTWIATTGLVSHRYTGMLREWRGLGIATALKAEALRRAKAQGQTRLDTHNSEQNAPMLAVNKTLGYVPDDVWVGYRKNL